MTLTEKAFFEYTDPYRSYGDRILVKISHTLRVEALCRDIAKSLGLSNEEVELAALCGLLHDIGRFEQWRRYETYNDANSRDHGDLGVEVLREDHLLDRFAKTDQEVLLKAVKFHNKYQVPENLPSRDARFVAITRDADKIDILYSIILGDIVNQTKNTSISPLVYETLLDHRTISNQIFTTKADAIAIRLAFLFDLNYPRSFEILKEGRYIDRFIDLQLQETANPELIRQLSFLRGFMKDYIEERIAAF